MNARIRSKLTLPPMRSSVEVLRMGAGVFVVPLGRRRDGLYKYIDAMERIEDDPTPEVIGSAVRAGMNRSVDGLDPEVPEFKKYRSFRATGTRSWTAFERGSQAVTVSSEPGKLILAPYRNAKGAGKIAIREIFFEDNLSDGELGERVLAAFSEVEAAG